MNTFRLLIVADEQSTADDRKALREALELIREHYPWGFEYEIMYRELPLVEGNIHTLRAWDVPKDISKNFSSTNGGEYMSCLYLFKDWSPSFKGINLSKFYGGMATQLCYWYNDPRSLFLLFIEELNHAFDEIVKKETGINLTHYLNLPMDIDEWIIHARGAEWRAKATTENWRLSKDKIYVHFYPLIEAPMKEAIRKFEVRQEIIKSQKLLIPLLEKLKVRLREKIIELGKEPKV